MRRADGTSRVSPGHRPSARKTIWIGPVFCAARASRKTEADQRVHRVRPILTSDGEQQVVRAGSAANQAAHETLRHARTEY
eukprot:6212967-Pleurochrysis_carterae.AAC.2